MKDERVKYVPATTRAVLARRGSRTSATINGETIEVSPHEMPGEVEWRVDLLNWYETKIMFDLVWLPVDERPFFLAHIKNWLISENELHPAEARMVARAVEDALTQFSFPFTFKSVDEVKQLHDQLREEWDELQDRYLVIIASTRR